MIESRVEEGKRRAAVVRASMTPEQLAVVERMLAAFNSRFVRSFSGPEGKKKGYNPVITVPVEEYKEFRREHPSTHRWTAWENSLDL